MTLVVAVFAADALPLALVVRITIVLAAAWTCDAALRRANPRWRILTWRAAAVGIVVVAAMSCRPPAFTLAVLPTPNAPTMGVETSRPTLVERPAAPSLVRPALAGARSADQSSGPSRTSVADGNAKQDANIEESRASRGTRGLESQNGSPLAATRENRADQSATNVAIWALVLWAAGVVALMARFVRGAMQVARVVADASSAPVAIRDQAATLAARCGAPSPVDVRQSSAAVAPCSAGIFRPVILLPVELCARGSAVEIQGALAHELVHLAGRDLPWNAALELVAALLWFHPLAWRLRVAHVDACDERCDAVATSVTADAHGYGRLLAQVALQVAGRVPAVALPMARTPQVMRRIALLSTGRGSTRLSRRHAVVAAVVGAVFAGVLGMSSVGRRDAAAAPAASAAAQANDADAKDTPKKTSRPQLSGRITDDTGAPVTDAEVSITGNKRSAYRLMNHFQVKTDANGRYTFDKVTVDDTYRLRVESAKWVGLTDWREATQLQLGPASEVIRDLTLARACRIRIRTVDEAGKPVDGVSIYSKMLGADPHSFTGSVRTDKEGWAEIGGLVASNTDYVFGTTHDDFAFGKLIKRLDDPAAVPEETIELVKGEVAAGVALCSDGKPATGWTINAMPDWWIFGATPRGAEIGKAGDFMLQHVAPDVYDLTVSVPMGDGMSRSLPVGSDKKLPLSRGILEVALSIPSPQSMGEIAGALKFSGEAPQESISVDATSEDRRHRGSSHLRPGETEFRITALPPGRYTLRVSSTEIEEVTLPNVKAPSEGLEIAIKVAGKPQMRGRVVDDADRPVTTYRVRVVKVGYTRGPGYVQDSQWQAVENAAGEFSVPVVGPGIYQAIVAADGWAPTRSEPINTDQLPKEPFTLRLTRGVTLRGTIVDEEGRPVDGATVAPQSASAGASPRARGRFAGSEGAVKTVDGKFTLTNLPAGTELLRVTHPDYCFAFGDEITIADADVDLKPITLTRGGTVRGTVYDSDGKPQSNVALIFNDDSGYSGGDDERAGRLASVVTDEAGSYEVKHLPAELCYVHLAEEWEGTGVVRSAILPANGEGRTLDLGGPRGVNGRVLVNGEPLANARLQLGGENPHFGVFKSYAQTDDDGRFTFGRPPAGGRVLWHQPEGRSSNWVRLGAVQITDDTTDLGDVSVQSGNVSIAVTGLSASDLSGLQVSLLERHPTWLFVGNDTGVQSPRADTDQPFVFHNVPAQKLEAVLRRSDGIALRHVIDVLGGDEVQEVTVAWPTETGTLAVEMPAEFRKAMKFSPPMLRSADGRIHGYLQPGGDEGALTLANLPVGDYFLTDQNVRDANHVLDFKIVQGETTKLDVNASTYAPEAQQLGIARIRWFGDQGIPLTGVDANVRGTNERQIKYVTASDAEWSVAAEPGEYELTASFPGYDPMERTITVAPPNADGRIEGDVTVDVELSPSR